MKYTKVGNVKDPIGNRKEDSGVDVYIPNDWNDGKPYVLRMNEQVNIPSKIKVKIKNTQSFIAFNKSGVSLKKGLVQGACVIDAGYTGILHCNLLKAAKGTEDIRVQRRGILGWLGFKEWATIINPGEKITQFILVNISNEPIEQISNEEYEKGPKTKRGSGAFGSTGTK